MEPFLLLLHCLPRSSGLFTGHKQTLPHGCQQDQRNYAQCDVTQGDLEQIPPR